VTLEQLRIFVGVAEREHMTRAAEDLNVTQSAASAAIAALEARHGIALFDRVGRGIALTEAGRMFLNEARAVLGRAASAELALAEFGDLRRGTLRIVASQTIAGYWLPTYLAAFRARNPGVALDVSIDNSEGVAARVRSGDGALGFVEGEIDDPLLERLTVAEDRLVLVSAAPFDRVGAERLAAAPWIVRERGSGTRSSAEAALAAIGVDPAMRTIAMTLPSNEAVLTAVEAGAGVAVLSTLVVRHALKAGALHAAPLDLPPRAFFALHHRERRRNKAVDALLELMKGQG
jgi:DNA-binding transcriptional LysR family regulator